MPSVNRVFLLGRLTRDPETRTFANGGKVASFGLAVNDRRKNKATGQWEDVPLFLDVEAYNRGEYGKTADLVEQYLKKGSQCFIEGSLKMDEWQDKSTGQKRTKLKIVVSGLQFLDSKRQERPPRQEAPAEEYPADDGPPPDGSDIPF